MFAFKITNGKFAGSQQRGEVPASCIGRRRPPRELLEQAIALGDGWYEVTESGIEARQNVPAPQYTVAEQRLSQAYAYLRGYARDFIIGNGTPTAQQRQNALDATIAVVLLERHIHGSGS